MGQYESPESAYLAFLDTFNARDLDGWAGVNSYPHARVSAAPEDSSVHWRPPTRVFASAEEYVAAPIWDELEATGWVHSVSTPPRVVQSSEVKAHIDGGAVGEPTDAPVVDGDFLLEPQLEAIAKGRAADVSLLVGTMDEEWNLFSAMVPGDPPSEHEVVQRLDALQGDGRATYDTYRRAREQRGELATSAAILSAASSDSWFVVASERMADAQSEYQAHTYSYTFDWQSPAFGGVLGSCHALDIPFTFGTHGHMPEFAGSGPEADELANCVMDAWIAFARSGDPSTPSLTWPAYNTAKRSRVMLGANIRVEEHWRAEERAVWADVI